MMTLEQVRDKLRSWYGGSEACLDMKACGELGAMADTITRYLSQTAEPTKLEDAVREVIARLHETSRIDLRVLQMRLSAQADKLTAALQENAK